MNFHNITKILATNNFPQRQPFIISNPIVCKAHPFLCILYTVASTVIIEFTMKFVQQI